MQTHSTCVTNGIRVTTKASYDFQHSRPTENYFSFTYTITISNQGTRTAKLLSRHWIISNAEGHAQEVKGPGVVGQNPDLAPGEEFTYSSFCPLDTTWGSMEGTYQMQRDDGEIFDAKIGKFYLTLTN